MSSSADVTRCISHLDCTELHGQKIFVVSYVVKQVLGGLLKRDFFFFNSFICEGALITKEMYVLMSYQSINDPFKKEGSKKEAEVKTSSNKPSDKRTSTATKMNNKWVLSNL